MRRQFLACAVILFCAIPLFSFSRAQKLEPIELDRDYLEDGKPLFSHDSLLICLTEDCTDQQLEQLLAKYNMTIMYRYTNFSWCAVNLSHDYTGSELRALIKELETNDCVVTAELNHIIYLDDPVKPVMVEM